MRNAITAIERPNATKSERATFTVPEAAHVLGIGKTLAYDLVKQGLFPAPVIRVGRRWVVSRVAVERLVAGDTSARKASDR